VETIVFFKKSQCRFQWFFILRDVADKSLARPISRSLRTESRESLERGFCSCVEILVFSCFRGWKI